MRPYRAPERQDSSPIDRFEATGSLDDLVDWLADRAARDGFCCEECGFPVRDPPMHPDAVIEALLARRVAPRDVLRALDPRRSGLALDARIEAIDEDTRRALFPSDMVDGAAPPTAIRFGVWRDALLEWVGVGDSDGWGLTDALFDAFDPQRASLALRTLLRAPTRRWFLEQLSREVELGHLDCVPPLLRAPALERFVRALLSDSPAAIEAALDEIDEQYPWFVSGWDGRSSFDLRESFALLCAHFGLGALSERWLRAVLRFPAVRSFDGSLVALAPHARTTQAALASLPERSRAALEEWAFCTLDRRDASANEWIALAQWSSAARAEACFTRAVARITAFDRGDEPFEGALLPSPLRERTLALSAARLRRWLDRRLRPEHADANESEDAHFRLRWFSPTCPATLSVAYELIRDARVVAADTQQFTLEQSARRWMHAVESLRDDATDAVLDERAPLLRSDAPLTRSDSAFVMLDDLLECAPSADRTRWIETIIARCPAAFRAAWPWATAEQHARMIASALVDARSLLAVIARGGPIEAAGALIAACMDRWVRIGCPLDSLDDYPQFVRRHGYFAGGRADPRANAWQLSRDALRERLRAQLAAGSLDWTIDPGPPWVGAMLGDHPADAALLDALCEQCRDRPEAVLWPYPRPELHLLARRDRSASEEANVAPSTEAARSDEAPQAWSPEGDPDEARLALRRALRGPSWPGEREIIAWLARVAPEKLGPLGDRVLDVILALHER